jgi:hypothetical protein
VFSRSPPLTLKGGLQMYPRDNDMAGPGAHETDAMNAIGVGRVEQAQVHAILALASAVSRLATAQEIIAAAQE